MSKGVQLALGVVSVLAGLTWLLASTGPAQGTFAYYESVTSFVDADAAGSNRGLRVHGFVVDGSVRKDLPAGHVDFAIRDPHEGAEVLQVRLTNLDVPDLFKEGAEVVVEGRVVEGRFLAERVMAKCPSKYESKAETEA